MTGNRTIYFVTIRHSFAFTISCQGVGKVREIKLEEICKEIRSSLHRYLRSPISRYTYQQSVLESYNHRVSFNDHRWQ